LGNVIALTDTAKVLKRSYDYDAWGQPTGGTDWAGLSGADRARFKGALWFGEGGTELHYMRNRWYEPKTGRFLSEDPIWLDGGINLYTFAGNDPINAWDPRGLACEWITEEYLTENATGDGLEKKTREVLRCSFSASGEATWRSGRGWGFGALSDGWTGLPEPILIVGYDPNLRGGRAIVRIRPAPMRFLDGTARNPVPLPWGLLLYYFGGFVDEGIKVSGTLVADPRTGGYWATLWRTWSGWRRGIWHNEQLAAR
jgi:RHS repeat-associated protein